MGKVFLSIMLVAAAFAGGATINGPGLRWVQVTFARLTDGEGAPAADTDKEKEPAAKNEPERPWSDMPGSAPAAAFLPKSPSPTTTPEKPAAVKPDAGVVHTALDPTPSPEARPTPAPAGDWAEIRRQMRELGV